MGRAVVDRAGCRRRRRSCGSRRSVRPGSRTAATNRRSATRRPTRWPPRRAVVRVAAQKWPEVTSTAPIRRCGLIVGGFPSSAVRPARRPVPRWTDNAPIATMCYALRTQTEHHMGMAASFSVRELRQRSGELLRNAEDGRLAVVTKRGRPTILAVPFDDRLLDVGVHRALALQLFRTTPLDVGAGGQSRRPQCGGFRRPPRPSGRRGSRLCAVGTRGRVAHGLVNDRRKSPDAEARDPGADAARSSPSPSPFVADAGPLIALARVGRLQLLQQMYGQGLIPPAVHRETRTDSARPGAKRIGAALAAGWLRVCAVGRRCASCRLRANCGRRRSRSHFAVAATAGEVPPHRRRERQEGRAACRGAAGRGGGWRFACSEVARPPSCRESRARRLGRCWLSPVPAAHRRCAP